MKLCPMETRFGYIVLAGRRFDHDIVLFPDGVVERRRKDLSKPEADLYAHTPLSARELKHYLERVSGFDCIVVGMGQSGSMKITPEAMKIIRELEGKGVKVFIDTTPAIVEKCDLIEKECRRPLAIIHVTC